MAFARWRQCALHVTHVSLGPPESTTQTTSRSVQPFFAKLTAESHYTLQRAAPYPLIIAHLPHLIRASLGYPNPQRKRYLDWFSRVWTADRSVSLYFTMGRPILPQNCPFPRGIWTPSNTWFIGRTRVHNPNGILIGSAVFAGLTIVSGLRFPT